MQRPSESDASKGGKNWKESLRRSGLPLEQLVAELFAQHGFLVHGEYPYARPNEGREATEFSVDLRASQALYREGSTGFWGKIEFLVECKFAHYECKWIFAPHPSSFCSGDIVSVVQQLCTKHVDINRVCEIGEWLPQCGRGVELNAGGDNSQVIRHGLDQLRFALPQLAKWSVMAQFLAHDDDWLYPIFLCPILVTTASLHVLKQTVSLESLFKAKDLREVADPVDALIVHQGPGPQLQEYVRSILRGLLAEYPGIRPRLATLVSLLGGPNEPSRSSGWLEAGFLGCTRSVLVANYSYLSKIVGKVKIAIQDLEGSLRQYARLIATIEGGESVKPIEEGEAKKKKASRKKAISSLSASR